MSDATEKQTIASTEVGEVPSSLFEPPAPAAPIEPPTPPAPPVDRTYTRAEYDAIVAERDDLVKAQADLVEALSNANASEHQTELGNAIAREDDFKKRFADTATRRDAVDVLFPNRGKV